MAAVAPSQGRELKHVQPHRRQINQGVAPSQGRELKLTALRPTMRKLKVAPSQGRELKQAVNVLAKAGSTSPLHRGVCYSSAEIFPIRSCWMNAFFRLKCGSIHTPAE